MIIETPSLLKKRVKNIFVVIWENPGWLSREKTENALLQLFETLELITYMWYLEDSYQ